MVLAIPAGGGLCSWWLLLVVAGRGKLEAVELVMCNGGVVSYGQGFSIGVGHGL